MHRNAAAMRRNVSRRTVPSNSERVTLAAIQSVFATVRSYTARRKSAPPRVGQPGSDFTLAIIIGSARQGAIGAVVRATVRVAPSDQA